MKLPITLLENIDDCFDESIHRKVLKKFPESDINKMVNDRVKFLDDNNDEKEDEDSENE